METNSRKCYPKTPRIHRQRNKKTPAKTLPTQCIHDCLHVRKFKVLGFILACIAVAIECKVLGNGNITSCTMLFFCEYRKCYDMCTQRAPYNWSEALYERHGQCIEEYLQKTVLPAFDTAHDGLLLSELVKRWDNHKIMNDWLEKFFRYLVCACRLDN